MAAGALFAQTPHSHTVGFGDLPPGIAARFNASAFDEQIRELERDTARRERDGEFEHLIYYALQSQHFTSLPRIEPALSAREFHDYGSIPTDVIARLHAFVAAAGMRPPLRHDARMQYFAALIRRLPRPEELLQDDYRRVMRFLYDKEVLHREHVYESRGHSTDTQLEANFAVWNGLAVLKSIDPGFAVRRVLIVGPGLDFAPRTSLADSHPPQSFQPYAVLDALLSLGLSRRADLRIDCGDINERVIEFINAFASGPRRLQLYSGAASPEYSRYFRDLGKSIGARYKDILVVDEAPARAVYAGKLNVLTSMWDTHYDLVIATNVLVYFNEQELALAHVNIRAMLRRGGYFVHNEVRPEIDALATAAGLEAVQARTVRINSLFDAFAIYRKSR